MNPDKSADGAVLASSPVRLSDAEKATQMILEATEGATEGCGIIEAVAVLISQRDNAYHYSDTFRAKLKELGHDYL